MCYTECVFDVMDGLSADGRRFLTSLFLFSMVRSFALTGGIACGKSMAEKCFSACGCRVLDADRVVWELEAPGGAAVEPIVRAFGEAVRDAQGGIDRAALGQRVFGDTAARKTLEAIVHPLVKEAVERWLAAAEAGSISVFSAALLYECGWADEWEHIVCIAASEGTQLRRMMAVRGMSEAAARARLAAQLPVAEKARRATWTLWNDQDDLPALKGQIEALVAQWRTMK